MGELLPPDRNGTTPGFGVAGQVLCPVMSLTHPVMCVKHACEFWVELTYGAGTPQEQKVGRCAVAWIPMVATEITQVLRKANAPA